jgi:hypothetical protein
MLTGDAGKIGWKEMLAKDAGRRRWQITGFDGMNSVCIASLVNASIGGD